MTVGLVTSVTPKKVGSSLTANVAVSATVLPVHDAAEFDEDFDELRYLVIGDDLTRRQYVSVENDDEAPQSVTLAYPLPVAADVGQSVTLWDPSVETDDKRAVEFVAQVRLDDQDDATIPATIPHALVPLAGVYSLVGAKVSLAEDESGEWIVDQPLGRAAVVESDVISTPNATGILRASQIIASTSQTTWTSILDFQSTGHKIDFDVSAGGVWFPTKAGFYLCVCNATYQANPQGNRGLRARIYLPDGTTVIASGTVRLPATETQPLGVQFTLVQWLAVGDGVAFEVNQNSGGNLEVFGGLETVNAARVSIVRIST